MSCYMGKKQKHGCMTADMTVQRTTPHPDVRNRNRGPLL
jgi:hypothetical protein